MIWVDVIPAAAAAAPRLAGEGVVVIDVLRATSTAVTALANGCRGLLPVPSLRAARREAERLAGEHPLLGGERKGLPIRGFDLGNSPLEYRPEVVGGRVIVFCTTNGTRALLRARRASRVYLGALLNSAAVARKVRGHGGKWLFFCAGTRGYFSWEDFLCAGCILCSLAGLVPDLQLGDGARAALKLAESAGCSGQAFMSGSHASYLKRLGFETDLAYCGRRDIYDTVPAYTNGWLLASSSDRLPGID